MYKQITLLIFAVVLIEIVVAQVPTFHQFYGNVVDENLDAITNPVSIKAYIEGSLVGTTTSLSDGTYGYAPLFFVEGGITGQTITFALNNTFSVNYTFVNEESTGLTLVLNPGGPIICTDVDIDNYNVSEDTVTCGVNDCNDTNSAINQGAAEICGNGIDENCDGSDATCPPTNPPNNGPSGSGGPTTTTTKTFTVDKTTLSFTVEQGSAKDAEFTVANTGDVSLTFSVTQSLGALLNIGSGFTLAKGESKAVKVYALVPEDQPLNLYVGHIYVTSGTTKKEIAVSIEVISKDSLFDIVLDIPSDDYFRPGSQLDADVSLTRMAESQSDEVQITYIIKDENEVQYFSVTEPATVETVSSFTKRIILPDAIKKGKYILYAQVEYGGKIASSSDWFTVGEKTIVRKFGENIRPYLWWIIMTLILASIIVVVVTLIIYLRRERAQGDVTSTATIQKKFS